MRYNRVHGILEHAVETLDQTVKARPGLLSPVRYLRRSEEGLWLKIHKIKTTCQRKYVVLYRLSVVYRNVIIKLRYPLVCFKAGPI